MHRSTPRRTSRRTKSAKLLALSCLCVCAFACSDDGPLSDQCTNNANALREDGSCIPGCDPIVTTDFTMERRCAKSGVALGCVPSDDSDFWTENHFPYEVTFICDVPVHDPAFLYCLRGKPSMWWYYHNEHLFCRSRDLRCNVPMADCFPDPTET